MYINTRLIETRYVYVMVILSTKLNVHILISYKLIILLYSINFRVIRFFAVVHYNIVQYTHNYINIRYSILFKKNITLLYYFFPFRK